MNVSTIFLIQIIITILFSIIAAFYDIKKNIVPDKLNYSLMIFGLLSNGILSLISTNIKFILASFISMVVTYTITYLLWKLNMWGGGDVKLFTAIATVIPLALNINFLNIFPQMSIYPFAFSVVINSILVSFPFLMIFLCHLIIKDENFTTNIDFLINIFNLTSLKYIINSTLNKRILIKDLEEGNIINNYYFNNEYIVITKKDMNLLKIMNAQNIISDEISIKISFPFTPAILVGLIIAVFYGDIMMLFAKNIVLVI